jgi:hypothetical protein
VDHAYIRRTTPETPWRTAAIVAAAVAAVELFMLVIVGVIFGAKLVSNHAEKVITTVAAQTASTHATGATPTTPTTSKGKSKEPAVAQLPRNRTSVIVLNGNGIPGAAAVSADKLRRFHYIVAATGNAPRSNFGRSVVMYRRGYKGEAIRLAHDLHVRRVVPLDGMNASDLQGAHIALILGG